ncbi:hypothetical protein A33O_02578 [Nitratireductor aquibiodomus RA22]|uniref:DUF112 domain-containing protein n=1 Tax=Nitratireductor aquibiodomus RA22 TaxID=1189611 RepID=I5C682_9HYPH|nr:tripartite tricarboxylate transporter permease [Nitratireductor aquibiodomus]EIM77334.1 hypothetical protein A33O_02578 [Nitratireductor aquibiodomus RA22]
MDFAAIFSQLADPALLLTIVLCTLYGALVGALPGLSATMAVALLVPFTFFMDPVPAIAAIVATTSTGIFAGDISGALLRIPGTPASAAYVADSSTIAHSGRPRTVLFVSLFLAAAGGVVIGVIASQPRCADAGRFRNQFLELRNVLARGPGPELRRFRFGRAASQNLRQPVHRSCHRLRRH